MRKLILIGAVLLWMATPATATQNAFLATEIDAYNPAFLGGVHIGSCQTSMGTFVVTGAGPGGGPHVRVWKVIYNAIYTVELIAEWMAYPVAFTGGVSVGCAEFLPGYLAVHTTPGPGLPPLFRVWVVEP